jgi:predicted nucleic acid-binding protein
VADARHVLAALREADGHRFLSDDVSPVDDDVPTIVGHRQVTDAHLLTLARRRGVGLVTFDAASVSLAHGRDVELLTTL